MKLKKLSEQVIVITGATSGIGLVTARRAAEAGAAVVLAARNTDALRQLADELSRGTRPAVAVTADVSRIEDVQAIADAAVRQFGRIDTWVNNAGVSIYGRIEEVSLADMRQLFETNFWGVVNGSRVAVRHLRHEGGALINVGSVLSDRAIPLQGIYCASKFAVKGFTEALRMEVEEAGYPVSLTLIKPSAIDTPYVQHAKNYMHDAPKNPAPVYAPEVVADAILHAATHVVRDLIVGGGGKAVSSLGNAAPRTMDKVMERIMFKGQHSGKPRYDQPDSLHSPGDGDMRERGGYDGHVAESSAYTAARKRPVLTASVLLGAGVAALALLAGKKGWLRRNPDENGWTDAQQDAAAAAREVATAPPAPQRPPTSTESTEADPAGHA